MLKVVEFSNILPIHNDQTSLVKHVLDPFYLFPPLLGCLEAGLPMGLGHNLLRQSTLCDSKQEIVETNFF